MDTTNTFPTHLLPKGYLAHFTTQEYKFRWHEATGLDADLHFRANHLASRLMSLWIVDAHLSTCKAELARITNTSVKTMDRALVALEDRGWVEVTRQDNLSVFLTIPTHGLQSLLTQRQNQELQRSLRQVRESHAHEILAMVALTYGISLDAVQNSPSWRIVRARVRSLINRMSDIPGESKKLSDFLCECPPTSTINPAAVVSSRIDDYLRRHPYLSRRPTKATRQQSASSPLDVDALIANTAQSLTQPRQSPAFLDS
jgi:hypothetical protein